MPLEMGGIGLPVAGSNGVSCLMGAQGRQVLSRTDCKFGNHASNVRLLRRAPICRRGAIGGSPPFLRQSASEQLHRRQVEHLDERHVSNFDWG
jgi:hypothetical protein